MMLHENNLVSAVPNSAGLERHVSSMGMSYGTRLGSKAVFLYKQLNKLCDLKNWEKHFSEKNMFLFKKKQKNFNSKKKQFSQSL